MKGFERDDLWFSLCGLNCGLCPMRLDRYCPGCGGGAGNQSCAIARCGMEHGGVAYCFQCGSFPCGKYEGLDEYDSFISHRNRRKDFETARKIGVDTYRDIQTRKAEILKLLLDQYNDGRKKRFFCFAVNLLELDDLERALEQLLTRNVPEGETGKERAAYAAGLLQEAADRKSIDLKPRGKPREKRR